MNVESTPLVATSVTVSTMPKPAYISVYGEES